MTQRNPQTVHVSVLLQESVDALNIHANRVYLDCTLGGGGHTQAILEHQAKPHVFAFDRDEHAIERAKQKFSGETRLKLFHGSFSEILRMVGEQKFNGILADLGISSDQLDEERGFSFHDKGILDMRMDQTRGVTAAQLLNDVSESELARLLSQGGVRKLQLRYARAIKKALPITTPAALAECIAEATPAAIRFEKERHPATVVFQALRIAVNQEYEELKQLLDALPQLATPLARVACISFHSGEDQLVAERLRKWSAGDSTPASWRGPRPTVVKPKGRMVQKQPIAPSEKEVSANPRSRSARLRVFEFFEENQCQ